MSGLRDRARALLAATADAAESVPTPPAEVPADPAEAPAELPRREHVFGSQWLVRQSLAETIRGRGMMGERAFDAVRRTQH